MDQGTHSLEANLFLRPLLALGFAVTIFLIAREAGILRRLFASRPMEVLGEQSYSLYLTHVPVLLLLNQWKALPALGFWNFMLIAVTACLVASAAFFLLVERPSLAVRDWVIERKSRVPTQSRARRVGILSVMAFVIAAPLYRVRKTAPVRVSPSTGAGPSDSPPQGSC